MQSFFVLKKFSILSTKFYSSYAEDLGKKREKLAMGLDPKASSFRFVPGPPTIPIHSVC